MRCPILKCPVLYLVLQQVGYNLPLWCCLDWFEPDRKGSSDFPERSRTRRHPSPQGLLCPTPTQETLMAAQNKKSVWLRLIFKWKFKNNSKPKMLLFSNCKSCMFDRPLTSVRDVEAVGLRLLSQLVLHLHQDVVLLQLCQSLKSTRRLLTNDGRLLRVPESAHKRTTNTALCDVRFVT